MTRRLLAAVALLVLAALCLLLAADVRSWQSTITGGDVVYASSGQAATWLPRTHLGGLSGDLLGVHDDLEARRALQLYVVAAATHARLDNATEVQSARAAAQDALITVAARGETRRSSQARTLLGILTFGSNASDGTQDQLDSAIADFADAIRADGTNVDAKFDLELLRRLTVAHGSRPGQSLGGGFGRSGRRGAGGGSPGKGY